LAFLVEPQEFLVQLLLAFFELSQLLLNRGPQLLEFLCGIVCERRTRRGEIPRRSAGALR
jgi:hypothetical protein